MKMGVKAIHVACSDKTGGASIAAYRLHSGLRRIGVQSSMLVGSKSSNDPDVQVVRRDGSYVGRLSRRLASLWITKDFQRYGKSLSPTLEFFSDDRAAGGNELKRNLPEGDVYNLHWVAGLLDYRRFFAEFPAGTPLVWTLHDMNPFTGGCHYTLGCTKYKDRCGECGQLGSMSSRDLSAKIHARKKVALSQLHPETTRIVAPSTWLADEARASKLLGRFDVLCIPYGLDTTVFQPRDRSVARKVFGVPEDWPVVMFMAESLGNHRKGFDLLASTLSDWGEPVTLASIGQAQPDRYDLPNHVSLGKIASDRLLSFALSAADVFVCPTRADNLPNVVLESMACGVPVIGSDVGGMPDIVRSGQTGILVAPEDVASLRAAIRTVLANGALRERFSEECRRVALEDYRLERQAARYKGLYEETHRRVAAA